MRRGETERREPDLSENWLWLDYSTDFSGSDFTGANFRNNGFRGKSSTYWRSDTDWTGATCPNGKKSTGYCNTDLS
jgi:uncharacterized protein YjbI with pentapeptide repeats